MIKGSRRHMVVLKNTGSPLFEEAYFILREHAGEKERRTDMVSEANRIIAANLLPTERSGSKHPKREGWYRLLVFGVGFLTGGVAASLMFLLG